jgi:hypothetical protein
MCRSPVSRRAALLGSAWALLVGLLAAVRSASAKSPAAPRQAPPASQPSSSGPAVPVQDPTTGRTTVLPPDKAADAIRRYWTPERMKRARPS